MTTTVMLMNEFVLPWEAACREDKRFREILKRLLVIFLLLAMVFPWLPLPEIERAQSEIIPPRLAKVILRQKLPAPPPVKQEKPPEALLKPEIPVS